MQKLIGKMKIRPPLLLYIGQINYCKLTYQGDKILLNCTHSIYHIRIFYSRQALLQFLALLQTVTVNNIFVHDFTLHPTYFTLWYK